jgi:hypothetical protein
MPRHGAPAVSFEGAGMTDVPRVDSGNADELDEHELSALAGGKSRIPTTADPFAEVPPDPSGDVVVTVPVTTRPTSFVKWRLG